jgi:HEAT repeat protein
VFDTLRGLGIALGALATVLVTLAEGGERPYPLMNACAGVGGPTYWIQRLKAPDPGTRVSAARALGESREGTAVPALIRALNDSDAEVRLAVIRALGRIGPSAKGAVPVLTRMREDEDSRVRAAVVGALGRIDR